MRGTWTRLSSDEGMTLVEIVVAAVIMFIILTGVLGLVGQTTMMSLQAKEKTVMANALNAYVEWVHSIPFEDVALVDDGGVLSAETSQTIGNYTVTIVPEVTAVTGNTALKTLELTITIADARGATSTHTTRVTVRDRTQFLTQSVQLEGTGPTITMGSFMPLDGAVVWGSSWSVGPDYDATAQPLYLDVSAEAIEGRILKVVRVSVGGIACVDGSSPRNRAEWKPDVQSWSSTSLMFLWDTTATEAEEQPDGTFVDKVLVGDGMRTLKVWSVDDATAESSKEIYVLVDNHAPATPGGFAASAPTARDASLTWAKAMDGGWGADSYQLEWVKQQMSDNGVGTDPFAAWAQAGQYEWLDAAEYPNATMSHSVVVDPFSRYAVRLRARSVRKLASDWTQAMVVSRPIVSGSYTITRPTKKSVLTSSTLSVTPPGFPTSGTVTYKWYRAIGAGSFSLLSGKTTATITDSYTESVNNENSAYAAVKYYATIDFTPSGYGGAAGQVKSNTVSTVTGLATPVTTRAYLEGAW